MIKLLYLNLTDLNSINKIKVLWSLEHVERNTSTRIDHYLNNTYYAETYAL